MREKYIKSLMSLLVPWFKWSIGKGT